MLDLRRLRLLRELSLRGTVGAVARELNFTPSAVSQQLAVLERETGVALLERSAGKVMLTDAGRILVAHAEILLGQSEAAEAALEATRGRIVGTVRVSSFQTGVLRFLIPAAELLAVSHPDVRVEMAEMEIDECITALRLQTLDVALGDEYDGSPVPRDPVLVRTDIVRQENRIILAADHPLAGEERVSMAALADAQWATALQGSGHRAMHTRMCREFGGFEPNFPFASDDQTTLLQYVRRLGAVTVLPDLAGPHSHDGVVMRSPREGHIHRTVFSLVRDSGNAPRPSLDAFMAALATVAARQSEPRGIEPRVSEPRRRA
jgi:DNA-binding transcriptional LysR family regulator